MGYDGAKRNQRSAGSDLLDKISNRCYLIGNSCGTGVFVPTPGRCPRSHNLAVVFLGSLAGIIMPNSNRIEVFLFPFYLDV